MRTVLRNRNEVCHYWANKVQSEGRAGNVFFEGDTIYSYGRHFAIARHLPSGAVAFSTRRYSNSTSQHQATARSAARHLRIVWCHNPDASVYSNREHALLDIRAALDNANTARRIQQKTRDAFRAEALRHARQFNEYLDALPAELRGEAQPIAAEIAELESFIAVLAEQEQALKQAAEIARQAEQIRARQRMAEEIERWRDGEDVRARFHGLPPMLRLKGEEVETSHGARIPVSAALALWPAVKYCKRHGKESHADRLPESAVNIGVYRLQVIRADGSVVIGCHDIPYAEIERIAHQLKLTEEV